MSLFTFFFIRAIIQKDANGGCVQIIVLPAALRPEKSPQENNGQCYAASDQEINNTHVNCLFLAAKWVAMLVNEIIVAVLKGIKMAATRGDKLPVTA